MIPIENNFPKELNKRNDNEKKINDGYQVFEFVLYYV